MDHSAFYTKLSICKFIRSRRFAAEIFHDLHDDILTIVSRGQSLKARVARLEVDLPSVEKALLAEASQFRFAYSPRRLQACDLLLSHSHLRLHN